MKTFRLFLIVTLALLASGCSLLQSVKTDYWPFDKEKQALNLSEREKFWLKHQQQLSKIDTWSLEGKLGIRTPNDSSSAYLDWEQQNHLYTIRLSGPLGQGVAEIMGKPGWVVMNTADSRLFTADSPEQLLARELGWTLPISNMQHWIKGIPDPSSDTQPNLNEQGLLAEIKQNGWEIKYFDYQQFNNLWLPRKIRVSNDQYKLTFIISEWHF
ncbi:outer membrane lipoprotein LolB [Zooshikella marina]|uniref:lipoprotein insertase outer membrane protein LolB n=1 Tax=Zooshikella ganghwensis TaxID=202772 RepID=UPI001BAFCE99|nr:lipoprotein insertase outer membrane protein LolB [Zooshikella ganghwensis]MBU2707223.1 outer membrane lipoprotein LolB [Zooshikella ganghwensis]